MWFIPLTKHYVAKRGEAHFSIFVERNNEEGGSEEGLSLRRGSYATMSSLDNAPFTVNPMNEGEVAKGEYSDVLGSRGAVI